VEVDDAKGWHESGIDNADGPDAYCA
jgi:hypothetical protein